MPYKLLRIYERWHIRSSRNLLRGQFTSTYWARSRDPQHASWSQHICRAFWYEADAKLNSNQLRSWMQII